MSTEKYLKEKEVAEILAVSVYSIAQMRHRGNGPPWIKVSGSVRYPADLFYEWIQKNTKMGSLKRAR